MEELTLEQISKELIYQKSVHRELVKYQNVPINLGGTTFRQVEESAKRIVYLFNLLGELKNGNK